MAYSIKLLNVCQMFSMLGQNEGTTCQKAQNLVQYTFQSRAAYQLVLIENCTLIYLHQHAKLLQRPNRSRNI